MGVLEAHVVFPEHGLELFHAHSAGTRKWIRVVEHEDVAAAAARLGALGFRIVAAHPSPQARVFRSLDYTRPTAFLMGAELHGVSAAGLEVAHEHALIPMAGMVHSLNVSVAAAILLYEAQRQRATAGMYDEPRLTGEAMRRTLFAWAYPLQAARCDAEDRPYPDLADDGRILAP